MRWLPTEYQSQDRIVQMSRYTRSERDQITYRAYDGRAVSGELIDRVLRELEARERRRERWRQIRTWASIGLIALVLLAAAAAIIWWRLTAS